MKNFGIEGGIIHDQAPLAMVRLCAFQLVDLSDLIGARMKNTVPAIGIIGGSGLYQMDEVRDASEYKIDTPFGSPSDALIGGKLGDRRIRVDLEAIAPVITVERADGARGQRVGHRIESGDDLQPERQDVYGKEHSSDNA